MRVCVCVLVCAKVSVAVKKSPSAQVRPVHSPVHTQVNPIGFSTQVAPLMHGDDKQACSTDGDGMERTGEGGDTRADM